MQFRQNVPGSPNFILTPFVPPAKLPTIPLLDPAHPSVAHLRTLRQKFPRYVSKVLSVWAYPKALLETPEAYWPDPPFPRAKYVNWNDRIKASEGGSSCEPLKSASPAISKGKRVNMALVTTIGKRVHKHAVIRRKIASKLKNATFLVVIHGAEAKGVDQITKQGLTKRVKLVFNRDEERSWILLGTPLF